MLTVTSRRAALSIVVAFRRRQRARADRQGDV